MPVSSNGTRHTRTSTIAAQNTNLQNIAWALYYNQILKRTIQIVFSLIPTTKSKKACRAEGLPEAGGRQNSPTDSPPN